MPERDGFASRIVNVDWSPAEPQPTEVITTVALPSPVYVMEEVQPSAGLDPRLILMREPASAQARSFRLLQHRLFAQHDPRVLAVTSASAGEGKTTCAVNMALVLSEETYARVLLIETNLQRPALAQLFQFEPADSLMTKLLRSEDASAPYAVASISGSRLQLAALHPTTVQGKRLDRALFAASLRALREVYDYVIIDAASVLESADANVACQCADACVLAARAGRSGRGALKRAIDQLQPANVAGCVLLDA